jgi:uncharacterized domain HDIG
MAIGPTHPRVRVARALAESLLAELPDRWAHTVGVARRAEELAGTVDPADRVVLVVAAWLHDIGYGGAVADTGFHPLDGARYLEWHGWPRRVTALVAHHSGAEFLARAQGLDAELARYPREESPVADALAYADQTTGPTGDRVTVEERLAEVLVRHGPGSAHARAHRLRGPYLLEVGERVERRLRGATAEAMALAARS